jgi:hypothetical protein
MPMQTAAGPPAGAPPARSEPRPGHRHRSGVGRDADDGLLAVGLFGRFGQRVKVRSHFPGAKARSAIPPTEHSRLDRSSAEIRVRTRCSRRHVEHRPGDLVVELQAQPSGSLQRRRRTARPAGLRRGVGRRDRRLRVKPATRFGGAFVETLFPGGATRDRFSADVVRRAEFRLHTLLTNGATAARPPHSRRRVVDGFLWAGICEQGDLVFSALGSCDGHQRLEPYGAAPNLP